MQVLENTQELPKVNFDFEEIMKLYNKAPLIEKTLKGKVIYEKDITEAKAYMKQYLYAMTDGSHFIWEHVPLWRREGKQMVERTESTFLHINKELMKYVYLDRLPIEISRWYLKENFNLYKLINDVKMPRISNEKGKLFINLCAGFKWKEKKAYSSFSPEIRAKVDILLKYYNEVLAGSNKEAYEYILNWDANVCQGFKNTTLLYWEGPEGTGKSTRTEFIIKHVLGQAICGRPGMDVIMTANNSFLCGKIFISFLEMPTSTEGEWHKICGKIKTMVTEDMLYYCNKYLSGWEGINTNNYDIQTNVSALKEKNGRRIFLSPMSTKWKENHAYFGNIKDNCFNDEVGEAFFMYLLERDVSNWDGQKNMPVTEAKLDSIVESMPVVFQYLKDEYLLKGLPISRITVQDMFKKYELYCTSKGKVPLKKTQMNAKFAEININHKPSNCQTVYKMSLEDLTTIANKNKWLHYLDDVDFVEKKTIKEKYEKTDWTEPMFDDEEDEPMKKKLVVTDINKPELKVISADDWPTVKVIPQKEEFVKWTPTKKMVRNPKKGKDQPLMIWVEKESKPVIKEVEETIVKVKKRVPKVIVKDFDNMGLGFGLNGDDVVKPKPKPKPYIQIIPKVKPCKPFVDWNAKRATLTKEFLQNKKMLMDTNVLDREFEEMISLGSLTPKEKKDHIFCNKQPKDIISEKNDINSRIDFLF
jgi:hypothetical protein